jgi:hypothetical protein
VLLLEHRQLNLTKLGSVSPIRVLVDLLEKTPEQRHVIIVGLAQEIATRLGSLARHHWYLLVRLIQHLFKLTVVLVDIKLFTELLHMQERSFDFFVGLIPKFSELKRSSFDELISFLDFICTFVLEGRQGDDLLADLLPLTFEIHITQILFKLSKSVQ